MILLLLSKVTDIPSLTVGTLSLCGRPTLLAATRRIGWPAMILFAIGMAAKAALSSPPQDGPHAQSK